MKKIVLLVIFLLGLTSFIYPQWARTYGGSEDDEARSLQQTSDGGYIIAGNSKSFGSGGTDIWVFKTDSDGSIEWQKIYGWGYNAYLSSVLQTSEGGYVVLGTTTYSSKDFIWILKLDPTGSIEWEKIYTSYWGASARSIHQTDDDGYIVAGHISTSLDENTLILKLSSSGEIEWDYYYIAVDNDSYSIQQTSDGGYIMAGYIYESQRNANDLWVLKLNSDGSNSWQAKYRSYRVHVYGISIQQTKDSGYVVAGYTVSWDDGNKEALILKLSSFGSVEWYRSYGEWIFKGLSAQQTADGGYIFLCEPTIISKFSSSGSREWSKKCNDFIVQSIQQTSDDGFIVTGYTSSFGAGLHDVLVLKIDSEGNMDSSCELIKDYSPYIGLTYPTRYSEMLPNYSIGCVTDYTSVFPQDTDAIVNLICPVQKYSLTISASTGGITDPVSGSYAYDPGTEVSITAVPNSGYKFTDWSGDASGTDNPITITMDSDKSVTANFEAIPPPEPEPEPEPEKKKCFIATAAYGSSLHPHIDILRDFRDKHLMTNKYGRKLVKLYYKYSPPIAKVIAEHKFLKAIVRTNLYLLVAFSYLVL